MEIGANKFGWWARLGRLEPGMLMIQEMATQILVKQKDQS
jgi:hypothetical protein